MTPTLKSIRNEPNYDPSYYEPKRIRTRSTTFISFLVLALELCVALLSLVTFDGFEECCGESIFYDDSPDQRKTWDLAFFWTSVAFMILVVLQVPLTYKGYNVALFNPVLGYSLTVLTYYNVHRKEAWIMFGVETFATICESWVLWKDRKFLKLFVQMLFCYAACGVTSYVFATLEQQGGYCIVDGKLESVFEESTCNMDCGEDDVDECYICDANAGTSTCFIQT